MDVVVSDMLHLMGTSAGKSDMQRWGGVQEAA